MKTILLFTFLGPLIGVLLFFLPSLIIAFSSKSDASSFTFIQGLSLFPVFFVGGYFVAILPAFTTGVIATFLRFENPWINYGILVILSVLTCLVYFFYSRNNDFILPSIVGVVTTMILGYIVFFKR